MEKLKSFMRDCLEMRGYKVTKKKLEESFDIYLDCQEWDEFGETMLSGFSYNEIEDFVRHSSCVDEIFG